MVDWFRRIATVVVALPLACTALHYDITSVLLAVIVSCGCFYEYCKGLMPPILSSLLPLKKDDTGDLKYPSRHNVTLLLAVCLASSFGVESLMRVHNVNIVGKLALKRGSNIMLRRPWDVDRFDIVSGHFYEIVDCVV